MKKIFMIVAGLGIISSAFIFQGCNKLKSLLQYDLTYTTVDTTFAIPIILDTLNHSSSIGGAPININLDSFIKANTGQQLGISNIKSARVTACTIALTDADSANNFQNLYSFSESFTTDLHSSPVLIGSFTNNPDIYKATFNVPVDTTVDYASYLNAHTISNQAGAKARRVTTKILHGQLSLTFYMHIEG